jgi:predicted nucleotidyltransferase
MIHTMKIQNRYRKPVAEFVRRVLENYKDKIDSIILFGSVARGEAREDSDVDILVVVKERDINDMKEIYGIAFEVTMEHSQAISLKIYAINEVVHRIEIAAPFIKEVLKEGVPVYGEIGTGKITA